MSNIDAQFHEHSLTSGWFSQGGNHPGNIRASGCSFILAVFVLLIGVYYKWISVRTAGSAKS